MPSGPHYVPILKHKRGELAALNSLSATDQALIIPVIELLQETADGDEPDGSPPNDAFGKVASQLHRIRPTLPMFIDLGAIDSAHRTSAGLHPVERVFSRCRELGMSAVPVTGLARDEDFQRAVAGAVLADGRGVCVRLDTEALEDSAAQLPQLIAALGLTPTLVDILLDFGAVNDAQAGILAAGAQALLANVPDAAAWRSVTFAAGSMPQSLSGKGRIVLPRTEWDIYRRLAASSRGCTLAFGDYGVAYPVFVSAPFVGAANIRYTIDDEWLIYRGGKLTGPANGGYGQYVKLSQQLVADAEFRGAPFSWGDDQIAQCAAGTAGTGNQTTWRAIGTSHHLTLVGRQLSTWAAPSNGALPPRVGP